MANELAWERQDGESSQAFAAFVLYRDLGPHRSLLKAYQRHKPDAELLAGLWSEWSARWRWLDRALAYDDHCDAQRRKVREKRLVELEARRVDFEIESQTALEKWVAELDGELRASLTEGYTEVEEELAKDKTGELKPVKRKTKIKFPSQSGWARLFLARHETLRLAVEGPRTKQDMTKATDEPGKSGGGHGGAFVWIKPDDNSSGGGSEPSK